MEDFKKYFNFWIQGQVPAQELHAMQKQKMDYNFYALHYVANVFKEEQLLSSLKTLLQNTNIQLNQRDTLGNTAIHTIIDKIPISEKNQVVYNNAAIKAIEMLLAAGSNLHLSNNIGETPLHIAIKKGDGLLPKASIATGNVIHFLRSKGANTEAETIDGNTPLHLAAAFGQADTVKYLLSLNINRNPQNKDGNTPLHYAVLVKAAHLKFLHNPVKVVQILVKQGGVDIHITNFQGQTPLQILEILFKKNLINQSNEHVTMKDILLNQSPLKEHDYYKSKAALDQVEKDYQALNITCTSTPTPWVLSPKTHSVNNLHNIIITKTEYAHDGTIISERRLH